MGKIIGLAAAVPFVTAATWACGQDPASPPGTPDLSTDSYESAAVRSDSATIGVGETVVFEKNGVAVTYVGLEGDSRCPIGVTCVWEGDGSVRIRLDAGASTVEGVLHTTLEPRSLTIGGHTVSLIDVLPRPVYEKPVAPSETRILVRVAG